MREFAADYANVVDAAYNIMPKRIPIYEHIISDRVMEQILNKEFVLVGLIHSYNKPFLYHSCGKIFDVMEDIIDIVKINAKHSNEDQIGR